LDQQLWDCAQQVATQAPEMSKMAELQVLTLMRVV